MSTVFSHIVQRRLSQENENVATEALAFILGCTERGRSGLMKLLRGVAPDLPDLHFRTQQTQGSARPDMWGMDGGVPRVFIENKFWAGLTDNQPVEYLRMLARCPSPSVLLVVVPEARVHTVCREFDRRLTRSDLIASERVPPMNIHHSRTVAFDAEANSAPVLALTSWTRVLSVIEAELVDEPARRSDLQQLRSLCAAADDDAAVPFAASELTNQRLPALVLQLNAVVQSAVDLSVTRGVLDVNGLRPSSSTERVGRYVAFPDAGRIAAWLGVDFRRWRERGATPLWLTFSASGGGRAPEVRAALQFWLEREKIEWATLGEDFAVGIPIVAEAESDEVVRSVVQFLASVSSALSVLRM